MAQPPQPQQPPAVEDTFLADRARFWARFMTFTKGAVIVVIVILLLMWVTLG